MRTLTQDDFLALWEAGCALHPLDQGLLALRAAFPEARENIADWPLGCRNRALAELRCASFGAALSGWTACRQCAEQLKFEIDGSALSRSPVPDAEARVLVRGDSYRLPTTRDLAAVVHETDATAAARQLLRQCRASGNPPQSAVPEEGRDEESEQEIEEVGQSMAAADPLAQILLSFDCPNCGAHFEEGLDLPSFIWAEVEARARRMLFEVHTLASAYGWSEAEILSLSPARRGSYLKMVHA